MLDDRDKDWLKSLFKIEDIKLENHKDNKCENVKTHETKHHKHINWSRVVILLCVLLSTLAAWVTIALAQWRN
jgi:hypothetical protein